LSREAVRLGASTDCEGTSTLPLYISLTVPFYTSFSTDSDSGVKAREVEQVCRSARTQRESEHVGPQSAPVLTPRCCVQDGLPRDKEELQQRQAAALRRWLDTRLGHDRAALVRLLASHGAVCKGGPEEAKRLIDALLVWKADGAVAGVGGDGESGETTAQSPLR
jgi:hypothetical protein